jgi:Domain of unknown function (DUF4386)
MFTKTIQSDKFLADPAQSELNATHPTRKTARVAGLLYLLVVIIGVYAVIYVPGRLFVRGNSVATANNILANQSLFRSYIVAWLVAEFFFISLSLTLYRLLKGVNQQHAAIMLILALMGAPLAFVSAMNRVATVAFVRGAEFLAVFDKPQRGAIAMLFFNFEEQSIAVYMIFWGLWLIPLGLLVFRSGFLPRILGGWLIINGLAYEIISFTGLLSPDHMQTVNNFATPALLGELAFTIWLLAVGARVRAQTSTAAAPALS